MSFYDRDGDRLDTVRLLGCLRRKKATLKSMQGYGVQTELN